MLYEPMTAQAQGRKVPQQKTTKLKPALNLKKKKNIAKLKKEEMHSSGATPCYSYFIAKFKHHFNCL